MKCTQIRIKLVMAELNLDSQFVFVSLLMTREHNPQQHSTSSLSQKIKTKEMKKRIFIIFRAKSDFGLLFKKGTNMTINVIIILLMITSQHKKCCGQLSIP